MQTHHTQFLCPQCWSPAFGQYCSHCSASLKIDRSQFDLVLRQWLGRTGYEEISRLGVTPSSAANDCGPVLALDRSHVHQLEALLIVDGDAHSEEAVRSCVAALRADLQTLSGPLLGRAGLPIKRVMVEVYLTYKSADLRGAVARLAAALHGTSSAKPKVSVRFVGIDLSAGDFHPKWGAMLDPEKRRLLRSVLGQYHLEHTLAREQRRRTSLGAFLHEVIGKPAHDLQELGWLTASILTRPMYYASAIQEERITLATALRYLGLLTIFIALVEGLMGTEELAVYHVAPMVDEALLFLGLLALEATGSLILWVGLRAVGGTGSYKKTLIATITFAVVVLPVAYLIDAVFFTLDPETFRAMEIKPGDRMTGFLHMMYAAPLLSVIHGIGRRRVFVGALLPFVALAGAAFVIVMLATTA
jgi:hypothetical protein